jgi:hypothetical protein
MPQQIYLANVVFGANITNYFPILANNVGDAASLALRAYDQNAAITLANGVVRSVGNTAGVLNAVGSNNLTGTVYVKDPANPLMSIGASSYAYQMTVFANTITPVVAATYIANGINAPLVTN